MYKSIYTVSDDFNCKKLYIYGVNREAVSVFTELAFRDADIFGFWDERFAGEQFMNRPIVSADQLMSDKDAVVILHKKMKKDTVADLLGRERLFYSDEILSMNRDLKSEKIFIYGIGSQGERIYKQLLEEGIEIEGGCVTQKEDSELWHGKPVFLIDEIGRDCKCAIIIATVVERYKREMLKNIEKYAANKYMYMFMESYAISEGTFFR